MESSSKIPMTSFTELEKQLKKLYGNKGPQMKAILSRRSVAREIIISDLILYCRDTVLYKERYRQHGAAAMHI